MYDIFEIVVNVNNRRTRLRPTFQQSITRVSDGRFSCVQSRITLITFITVPSFAATIGPTLILGIGCGLIEVNIYPILAILVDTRHKSDYGSVYAIADISICLGFIIGMAAKLSNVIYYS